MKNKSIKQYERNIKQKLINIHSPVELKQIYRETQQQNKKLASDIREFKNLLTRTMEKINKPTSQPDPSLKQKLHELGNQLKQKYKQIKKLKKQISQYDELEDVKMNRQKRNNQIILIQQALEENKKKLNDLNTTNIKLTKTMEDRKEQDNLYEPKIKQISRQNHELKINISQKLKIGNQTQNESIKVQTTLVSHTKSFRNNLARKSMIDVNIHSKKKKNILQEYESLAKEVDNLKGRVQQQEENQLSKKYGQTSLRESLLKENQENIYQMKELDIRKARCLTELNFWKNKLNNLLKFKEKKRNRQMRVHQECQVSEFVDGELLRRQYAGIIGKNKSDDRLILKDNKTAKIVGLTIYENERGLIGISAHYDCNQKSLIPIPPYVLSKTKSTKISVGEEDFFKLFKIKYNVLQNRVIKIEVRSNKNIKYQYGDKKSFTEVGEGDTVYGFDIRIHQYPVSMFVSYGHFKGNWFIQGMGVEVNDLL